MSDKSAKELSQEELVEVLRDWHPELKVIVLAKRDWDATMRTQKRAQVLFGYFGAALGVWVVFKYDWIPAVAKVAAAMLGLSGGAGGGA